MDLDTVETTTSVQLCPESPSEANASLHTSFVGGGDRVYAAGMFLGNCRNEWPVGIYRSESRLGRTSGTFTFEAWLQRLS